VAAYFSKYVEVCYSSFMKLRVLYGIEIYKKIADDIQSCHRRSDEANDQYIPKQFVAT
jgi:hypothetical protein